MWYQDTATNWVYIRMIIRSDQTVTPSGTGSSANVQIIASMSQSLVACTVPSVADNSILDTVRVTPAAASYLTTPAPWTGPANVDEPRDSFAVPSCAATIPPGNGVTNAPTAIPCETFSTCPTCLTGGCQMCPDTGCQLIGSTCPAANHLRTLYCEDDVDQIIANGPNASATIIRESNTKLTNDAELSPLGCSVTLIGEYTSYPNAEAHVSVSITCESIPTATEKVKLCDAISSTFVDSLSIALERINCTMGTLAKRAVSGTAEILISQPGTSFVATQTPTDNTGSDGISGGAIAGIVIGVIVALIVVVVIVLVIVMKTGKEAEERY